MSTATPPMARPASRERDRPAWLYATPMWAGLAIVSIWLAVLFVGIFGGDIVTYNGTPGVGNGSTVPSVVVVVPCALLATWIVARWGFGSRAGKGDGAS